jgi:hypothetical protein
MIPTGTHPTRLVSRPLAYSQPADPFHGLERFWFRAVVGYPTNGVSDARGGPVPKICNRVPSHGPTGPTKAKSTNLESPSGAMASLRQAD